MAQSPCPITRSVALEGMTPLIELIAGRGNRRDVLEAYHQAHNDF